MKNLLMSIGITALLVAVYALLRAFVLTLDGGWNTIVYNFGFILLEIFALIGIWFEKHREWCPVFDFIIVFLSLANIVYYECISTGLEATWHFHSAHNVPFSKITITESYKYDSGPLFGSGSPRGVDILYDGIECSVYNIEGKWMDNYEETLAFSELNTKVKEQLDSILAEGKKKYQIFLHPFCRSAFECTYDVILYTKDKALEKEKIVELDTCISNMNKKKGEYSNWSEDLFVTYHLYTVRDKKLYKKLCKAKKYNDSKEYEGSEEILTPLYKYSLPVIYETDRYNNNVFLEYGNTGSSRKTTIFLYSSSNEEIKLEVYSTR